MPFSLVLFLVSLCGNFLRLSETYALGAFGHTKEMNAFAAAKQ